MSFRSAYKRITHKIVQSYTFETIVPWAFCISGGAAIGAVFASGIRTISLSPLLFEKETKREAQLEIKQASQKGALTGAFIGGLVGCFSCTISLGLGMLTSFYWKEYNKK